MRPRRDRHRIFAFVAAASAVAIGIAGCTTGSSTGSAPAANQTSSAGQVTTSQSSGGADGTPSAGGATGPADSVFNVAIDIDLDTVDPVRETTTTVSNAIDYAIEGLVRLNSEGKVEPLLATKWETAEDGKSITFELRQDVTFHDGSKFDANAVKFNFDRLLDPDVQVPLRSGYLSIDSVDAVSDYSVRLNLKRPDPTLLPNLAYTMSGMLAPDSIEKDGNSYDNVVHPVGTGPYAFTNYKKSVSVEYSRFDEYWGEKPYYGKMIVNIVPEPSSREAGLLSGQYDMIMHPPASDIEKLNADSSVTVFAAPSDRAVYIAINTHRKPFDDPLVRQALNYAIDTDAIVKNVVFDVVTKMDSPVPSSVAGYCSAGEYPYDPDKAKDLLSQAGVSDLKITLGSTTGHYLQDMQAAQAMSQYWRDIGATVDIKTMDWASYLTAIQDPDGPFDMGMLGWAAPALDSAFQMSVFQKDHEPPNGFNVAFYTNPKVEELIASANSELDEATRNKQYCDAQKLVWDDAPWVFMWEQPLLVAYSSKVTGISSTPNEKFNTIYARPAA